MNIFKSVKEHYLMAKNYADRVLIIRLSFFAGIFLIMLGLIFYDIIEDKLSILLAIIGFSLGYVIGNVTGRVFSLRWHHKESKVISRIDTIGVIILIPYFTFTVFREWILERWFHGDLLFAFTLSLIAGIMLGRVIYLIFHIKKTLDDQGISVPENL